MPNPTVQDIMNRNVISVHPETSLLDANALIASHNIDGVPVVDQENKLVGILTEYDLIVKGSSIHLPTFQEVLSQLTVNEKDRSRFQEATAEISKLTVRDIMNDDPLTLPDTASFAEVVTAFRDHHRVNPIPVVDQNHQVVGVVSRFDVLKLFEIFKTNI